MTPAIALAFGAATLLVALNAFATVRVFRSDFTSPMQKTAQLVLTWLVPFVGAIFVIAMLSNSRPTRDPTCDPATANQYLLLQNTLPADTFGDSHSDASHHSD